MRNPGELDNDLLVRSRSALLDALEALAPHKDSVVVIGAQAVYLRTSAAPVALAETTKDSDLVLDPRTLEDDPLIEQAMTSAGFYRNLDQVQPGAWLNAEGISVDLMVPEFGGSRGAKSTRSANSAPRRARNATRTRP
jgi:hypothetical protein